MQRAASFSKAAEGSKSSAIAGSLVLVTLSFVLLLAAPVASRQLRSLMAVGSLPAFEAWLPVACSAGLVLGGGAALLFVLVQIVREAERRPYVCLAPVLAAFAACLMIGLRAELPLQGVAVEHVTVFALALTVVGGSLVQHTRVSAQLLGLGFALMPPACLFVVLWAVSGKGDPAQALWSLPTQVRAYLAMLTGASFTIATVALLGRREGEESARDLRARDPFASLPRGPYGNEAQLLLEQSYAADEAALTRRGMPSWVIAAASGVAVVVGFFALKLAIDGRASSKPALAPVAAVVAPPVAAARVAPEATAPIQPPSAQLPLPTEEQPAAAAPVHAERASLQAAETLDAPVPVEPAQPRLAPESVEQAPAHLAAQPALETKRSAAARPSARGVRRARSKPTAVVAAPAAKGQAERHELPPAREQGAAEPSPLGQAKASVSAPPKPAAALAKPAAAPAPTRGDESLDELMDRVTQGKGDKKSSVTATDDPIFGL